MKAFFYSYKKRYFRLLKTIAMRSFILLFFCPILFFAQNSDLYNASSDNPFGIINPDAPTQVADYEKLIGECDCLSSTKNKDNTWSQPQKMTWTFKYIMNGMAVQDESHKEDGSQSGSIRQFVKDSLKWYVHWYSTTSPTTQLSTWEGTKNGDDIVLYKPQKAPNGMDGFYRLSFKNISETGFNWIGEWVDASESVVFPTWKIDCKKRSVLTNREIILKNIASFSNSYIEADYEKLASFYTEDGKIFPNKTDIISGRDAIQKRWTLPEGITILNHKVTPVEITILNDTAYDYGYYEGKNKNHKNEEFTFKGKYVIVWKKIDHDWKIYLDIWNSL